MILLLVTISIWCRLFYNKRFGWFDDSQEFSFYSLSIFVPIALTAQSIFKVFTPLQINAMIMFFMSIAFLNLKNGREYISGMWLGLAAAIKVFPVLMMPYLLYRKKFKTILSMTGVVVVLTMIPVFRYGWEVFLQSLTTWIDISLKGGYPTGGLNQSAYAMITRWIASDPFLLMSTKLANPPIDSIESIISTWVFRLLYLFCVGIFLFFLHKKKSHFLAVEAAFFITISMVFSPIAWKNYWILTFPAFFTLYNLYLNNKNKVIFYSIWTSFFLITVLQVVGEFHKLVRGFFLSVTSSLTIGAFVLLFALTYYIFRSDQQKNRSIELSDASPINTS